jgi:autotransporter-associated beta strand protein
MLVLSGSNTYSGATVVDAGVLEAGNANALGANAGVTVNGRSPLVSSDDAINGKNLVLASTTTGNGTAASLIFSGTYNGTARQLTLQQDSIIDFGEGNVGLHFSELIMGAYNLTIHNWTGSTLWGGGDGNNADQFYIDRTLTTSELNRISFHSGLDNSSFVGTGYQLSGGSFNNEIIPVPEPETWATAALLVALRLIGSARSMLIRCLISIFGTNPGRCEPHGDGSRGCYSLQNHAARFPCPLPQSRMLLSRVVCVAFFIVACAAIYFCKLVKRAFNFRAPNWTGVTLSGRENGKHCKMSLHEL